MLIASKRLFVLLFAILPLHAQSANTPTATSIGTGVVIAVTTDRSLYKPNEPIKIRAAILNGGSQPFYVIPTARFGYYGEGVFRPELRDTHGREILESYRVGGHSFVPENADFVEYVQQYWILLQPGCFYGVADKRFSGIKLSPGTYTLRVVYENSLIPWITRGWTNDRLDASTKKLNHPAITGKFISQTVTFRVVQ